MKKSHLPVFIYGTAWKKQETTKLVEMAIENGFRAIDTANQLKHYSEALVGNALLNLKKKGIDRDDLWLQTKFTSIRGQQDEAPPYDVNADLTTQVNQSFASSLEHLHTDYLDSYLLHGPYNFPSLGKEDLEVWKAIEEKYKSGKVHTIGVSNMNLEQMKVLVDKAEIKPMMLQNRCYANCGWDKDIRQFCLKNNIQYQGFSLLTANQNVMEDPEVVSMATSYSVTPAQIIFRFATQIGILPITGSSNQDRIILNLSIKNFVLKAHEMSYLENIV
ncbi:MAG: aldo/keto reductase family protein [Bacteriovoracaceae bacterium]